MASLSYNPNAWHAFLPNNVLTDVPLHQRRTVSLNINNIFKVTYDQARFASRFAPLEFEDKYVPGDIMERFARDPISGEFVYADEFNIKEDKFKRADNVIVD